MKRFFILFGLAMTGISLTSCTLTPSRSNAYDLLDTEYKAETQDPVAVPIKEASDKPWIKTSPVLAPAPLFIEAPEKPPEKLERKIVEKTEEKTTEPKILPPVAKPGPKLLKLKTEEKKAEEKKPELKKVASPVTPPTVAAIKPAPVTMPCDHAKTGSVAPPPPPAGTKGPQAIPAVKRETLQSGDRLKITVFREKDLTGEYQVNDKGMISFPMIGELKVAGSKPSELQNNLTAALAKGYLVKPEINVEWLSDCNSK